MMIGRKLAVEIEHVEHAEDASADLLGQVLLELGLGRDRDVGVGDPGQEREHDRRPTSRVTSDDTSIGETELTCCRKRVSGPAAAQDRQEDPEQDQAGLDRAPA